MNISTSNVFLNSSSSSTHRLLSIVKRALLPDQQQRLQQIKGPALNGDAHSIPQHNLTHIQTTLLIAYSLFLILWLTRIVCTLLNLRFGLDILRRITPSEPYTKEKHEKPSSSSTLSLLSSSSNNTTHGEDNKNDEYHQNSHRIDIADGGKSSSNNFEAVSLKSAADNKNVNITLTDTKGAVGGDSNLKENLNERHHHNHHHNQQSSSEINSSSMIHHNGGVTTSNSNKSSPTKVAESQAAASASGSGGSAVAKKPSSGPPAVTFETFLNSIVLFGAIMTFFYLCDYWKVFPQGGRTYSRDTFLFLVFIFFLVGSAFTLKDNPDKVLNRDQTEEWKGWMQVMFVWYHYFEAKEWYNWIRVYIACYVWMTGFGNFSFFWLRKDFSMWRLVKMLFRLNFLVVFVAMVTNNQYMLYYICAMHTYWFLTVYVFMRVFNSWNTDPYKMAFKFIMYAVFNAILFEVPGVFNTIFKPFSFVLGIGNGGSSPNPDVMHEWHFRSTLDHWACFVGMLCAYNYPHYEALMLYLDTKSVTQRENVKKIGIRLGLGISALLVGVIWHETCLSKEKYPYNAQHPYTSAIPIMVFIVLRNIHPVLRTKHIAMFSWLGKITLETYLSQLHVYLLSNARSLLVYMPAYPLLNFALATIVYLSLSHFLFNITNDTSNYIITKDRKRLLIHLVCMVLLFGGCGLLAYGFVV